MSEGLERHLHGPVGRQRVIRLGKALKQSEVPDEPLCFLIRRSDGAFYRGARFWKWTKRWNRAALLPRSFWKGWVIGCSVKEDEVDLYTVGLPPNAVYTHHPAMEPK